MRIVCSFVGGAGHLVPQIPLHRAFREAGHTLVLVGRESATRQAPPPLYDRVKAVPDRRSRVAATITPLLPLDVEAEIAVVARHFAGDAALRSAAAVDDVLPGADLLICDELDFGAMAAAQARDIPTVVVSVIATGALVHPDSLAPALDALRDRLGMGRPVRPRGDVFVVPFAPDMREDSAGVGDAGGRSAATGDAVDVVWMRPDPGPSPHPDGSVIATLGTEFNTESGDLFDRILAALAQVDAPAQVAVGHDLDPARFGRQPPHVEVRQHIDLAGALPRASAVLHHGGSGLLVQSVLAGAPQVVVPMGADQPFNAELIERLGLGVSLDSLTATPAEIKDAVERLLADTEMRDRSMRLRASMLALPHPAEVAGEIERRLL